LNKQCVGKDSGLLAYSPLGFGVLSGKYLGGQKPAGARLTLFERFSRYTNPQAEAATEAYVALAREHDLDPAQMAMNTCFWTIFYLRLLSFSLPFSGLVVFQDRLTSYCLHAGKGREQDAEALRAISAVNLNILDHNLLRPE
jgi:hypothetical protein